jgi:hypothetical protein
MQEQKRLDASKVSFCANLCDMNTLSQLQHDATLGADKAAYAEIIKTKRALARKAGHVGPDGPFRAWCDWHRLAIPGFAQVHLAQWLGLKPSYMSQLIRGRRRPSTDEARRIVTAANAFVGDGASVIPLELGDLRPDVWE